MKYNFVKELMGQGADFQKPPRDDAFGDLDDDPPDFEVMAVLGGSKSDWQKSGLVMYAWKRTDHTQVVVTTGKSLLSAGLAAKQKLRKFVNAIQGADPSAEIVGV